MAGNLFGTTVRDEKDMITVMQVGSCCINIEAEAEDDVLDGKTIRLFPGRVHEARTRSIRRRMTAFLTYRSIERMDYYACARMPNRFRDPSSSF
jgi:hypothetical protein